MGDDPLDDFFMFDVTMGADTAKCPHCGAEFPCSLLLDDEVTCPKCGTKFKKDEGNK